jgi:tryptophanyl-tRNA synthetase
VTLAPDLRTRTKRVLTGYRPTGPLHVGHWAGNVENMLRLQDDGAYECFFFIADWHMLTTHYDRTDELPGFIEGLVLDWLAAGIDPDRAVIYRQSHLPEVAEIALLLGMITPLGWLERVPSFKERLRDMAERDIANFGLLGYPVLQTVDIAIVRGELVPVGEDQVAHLELSREIVRRFNRLYGDVLVEPQPLLSDAPLIPGSDGRKMSKSLDNAIGVRAEPAEIRRKVRTFLTDPQKLRRGDPGRPEICPVFALHRTFSPDDVDRVEATCRTGELGCVDCKDLLAENLIERFRLYRERRAELESKPGVVDEVLAAGAERVRPVARETLLAVREAMHLG